jgi:GntR family transcriptional regulator/MocR family aminotransferase
MNYFHDLIKIDKSVDTPVYLQIASSITHQIRNGSLRKGSKMPSSRSLADWLGVNRMTVVAAYDELRAQGWIIQYPRKGSFVHDELPVLKPRPIKKTGIPFSASNGIPFPINKNLIEFPHYKTFTGEQLVIDDGFPDVRLAPIEELARCMKGLCKIPSYTKYLRYGATKGNEILRDVLAEHLNDTRGLPVTSNNLLITRGATMGIYLAARVITQPGDHIIMSEPGFRIARAMFSQLQLNINTVSVDEHGISIEAIEQICKTKNIRFVYTVPHHHYPTTVTLSPERRIRILELAKTYNFAIIEDDYDYDFHYTSKPMMPMASIDKYGSVVYIGTLAKTLAPSIRIGFLTATENFVNHAASYRILSDFQGDNFLEAAISELYKDGTIARHIKKSLKTYKERRDHFCKLLKNELDEKVSFKIPNGGMSVWIKFNDVDLIKLSKEARIKGLEISDGTKYDNIVNQYNSIRMGFASLNFDEQKKAVTIIKSCL